MKFWIDSDTDVYYVVVAFFFCFFFKFPNLFQGNKEILNMKKVSELF